MNTTTTFNAVPADRTVAPRGARWGASLLAAGWQTLSRLGAPIRRELTRAEEAAQVREMARRMQATDPGFASDLLAAADRHERTAA